jgi:hypothetical protein
MPMVMITGQKGRMGDVPLESAMASGALEAHGPTDLRRRLNDWLGLSAFAPIRSARDATIN